MHRKDTLLTHGITNRACSGARLLPGGVPNGFIGVICPTGIRWNQEQSPRSSKGRLVAGPARRRCGPIANIRVRVLIGQGMQLFCGDFHR
jgi:hypothetical protein